MAWCSVEAQGQPLSRVCEDEIPFMYYTSRRCLSTGCPLTTADQWFRLIHKFILCIVPSN